MDKELKNNLDWAGEFMTMSMRCSKCTSEEMLYQAIRKFREDMSAEYGKLQRADRLKDGFSGKEGD